MPATLRRFLVPALALSVALPVAAAAETFTVTLHNGSTVHTRYQPQAAPWDAGKILVRTEVGNLISLSKADVATVQSDTENRGFGKVINNTTVMLGDAPNDAPTGDDAAAYDDTEAQTPYTVQQFVEPGATQGLPGALIGNNGYMGTATSVPPAPRPAAPAPKSPPGNQG